jgi:hypothetical protein
MPGPTAASKPARPNPRRVLAREKDRQHFCAPQRSRVFDTTRYCIYISYMRFILGQTGDSP